MLDRYAAFCYNESNERDTMNHRKNKNFSDLKASARRMGLNVVKVARDQGSSISITRLGNAARLYEVSTVEGGFRCLSSEQDKRAKAQAEIDRRAQERSDLTDECLVS
jgi:urocanate hydratase